MKGSNVGIAANLFQLFIGVVLIYANLRHGLSGLLFIPFLCSELVQLVFLIPGIPWRAPLQEIHYRFLDLAFALISANFWILWNAIYTVKHGTGLPLLGFSFYAVGLSLSFISTIYLRSSFSVLPERRKIITAGPYRYIRHPIYVGYVLMSFGQSLAVGNMYIYAGWVLSTLLYYGRSRREDGVLYGKVPSKSMSGSLGHN